jgi:hypothetical protein
MLYNFVYNKQLINIIIICTFLFTLISYPLINECSFAAQVNTSSKDNQNKYIKIPIDIIVEIPDTIDINSFGDMYVRITEIDDPSAIYTYVTKSVNDKKIKIDKTIIKKQSNSNVFNIKTYLFMDNKTIENDKYLYLFTYSIEVPEKSEFDINNENDENDVKIFKEINLYNGFFIPNFSEIKNKKDTFLESYTIKINYINSILIPYVLNYYFLKLSKNDIVTDSETISLNKSVEELMKNETIITLAKYLDDILIKEINSGEVNQAKESAFRQLKDSAKFNSLMQTVNDTIMKVYKKHFKNDK